MVMLGCGTHGSAPVKERQWRELVKYGFKDWLRFLWVWSWQQGLGRPV